MGEKLFGVRVTVYVTAADRDEAVALVADGEGDAIVSEDVWECRDGVIE